MELDLLIFFGVFLVLLVVGSPIYLSMIVPSLIYMFMNPELNFMIMVQKMITSLNSFALMAMPFFILAGNVMNVGSVTTRIFNFARKCIGHYRGGLGYVNILSSVIFSGMSGSALADVGGLGQVELKAMREEGYDDAFSIGITCASGTIGPIIPPSAPFVVFAAYSSVSTGALFMGGFLPGLLIAFILGIMVYYYSRKNNYPAHPRASFKERIIALKDSILALLMPVIIIGGIWTGWFTATEAALIAIVYALLISLFIFRDMSLKEFVKQIDKSARGLAPVFMVIVGATMFCWIISYEKLDEVLLNALVSLTSSRIVILLLICVFVTIMGMFFDNIVTIMLIVPIMFPICAAYNIEPIHLGVIVVLGNMIGLLTPPVGMSIYMMSSMTKIPFSKVTSYILPWLLPLFVSWLIIALCEPIVMLIPNLMGIGGAL